MKRLAYSFYGFQTAFTLYVWMPIFFVYHQLAGLGTEEIFGIQAYYYVVFIFFEIPTGFLSDRFGHRTALRWGAAVLVVSHLFAIFTPSFVGLLVHWLLLAGARSLVSGAASAYLYEKLEARGALSEYKRIEGNARAFGLVAKIVAWTGVGLMMQLDPTVPYWVSTVFAAVAFFIALGLEADVPVAKSQALATTLRGVGAVFKTPRLLWVMLIGVGVFVIGRIVQVNAYQPLLLHHDIPLVHHGMIMAAMTIVEAVGSARAYWLRRWVDDLRSMLGLTIGVCASMMIMVISPLFAIAGLLLFALTTGVAYPIQKQLMNDAIGTSGSRATLLSVESIVDRAFSAGGALVLGAFLARGELDVFFIGAALATALLSVVCYLAIRHVTRPVAPAPPEPMAPDVSQA